jgi:hypothetical protein
MLIASVTTALTAGLVPAAFADGDDTDHAAAIARTVLLSADPEAALASLSPSDQAVFAEGFTDPDVTVVAGPAQATDAAQPDAVPDTTNPGDGGGQPGCWSRYYYYKWSDAGIPEGSTWMELDWCNNAVGTFTKKTVTNVGGQGLAGVSYLGVISSGMRVASGQVRAYREYKFKIGPVTEEPCLQIRGAIGGSSSTSRSCDMN